jgi:Protein of unknown function (DUF3386)
MTDLITASVLFQTTYESLYTWDENFPGYSADLQLVKGSEVYTGSIRINHDLSVEVIGITDEQVHEQMTLLSQNTGQTAIWGQLDLGST